MTIRNTDPPDFVLSEKTRTSFDMPTVLKLGGGLIAATIFVGGMINATQKNGEQIAAQQRELTEVKGLIKGQDIKLNEVAESQREQTSEIQSTLNLIVLDIRELKSGKRARNPE